MQPNPDRTTSRLEEMPYELVYALTNELGQRDDPLATLWAVSTIAEEYPGLAVTAYDPDDPLDSPRTTGMVWVGSLREAGADPSLRGPLVKQAMGIVAQVLDLVREWEVEAGTSELESRWTEFARPYDSSSRPGGHGEA